MSRDYRAKVFTAGNAVVLRLPGAPRCDRLIATRAVSPGPTPVTGNMRDVAGIPGLCVEDWTA